MCATFAWFPVSHNATPCKVCFYRTQHSFLPLRLPHPIYYPLVPGWPRAMPHWPAVTTMLAAPWPLTGFTALIGDGYGGCPGYCEWSLIFCSCGICHSVFYSVDAEWCVSQPGLAWHSPGHHCGVPRVASLRGDHTPAFHASYQWVGRVGCSPGLPRHYSHHRSIWSQMILVLAI